MQIDEQVPLDDTREEVAEQIRQKALDGKLKAYDCNQTPPKELPSVTWTKLETKFDPSGIPFVRWRGHWNIVPAYDLRFSKKSVLQCFPAKEHPQGNWALPDYPPPQPAPQAAYRALKHLFPTGLPRKYTPERLAQMAGAHAKKMDGGSKPIKRETILRVFGQKK